MSKQTYLPQLTYTPSRVLYTGDRVTGQARAYWALHQQIRDDLSISVRITHDLCDTIEEQMSFYYHKDGTDIEAITDKEYKHRLEMIRQHEGEEAAQVWCEKHVCIDVLPTMGARGFGWPTLGEGVWADLVARWSALKLLISPSVCH